MKIIKEIVDKYFVLTKPVKIFALLISSVIIVHVSAWVLDTKFGNSFYIYSSTLVTYSDLFSPAHDGGYFEHFQYILLIWCGILSLLWIIGRRYFEIIYLPFIYFYLFLDDALSLHDGVGKLYFLRIYNELDLFNNNFIRIKDIAEWSYWIVIFFVILIFARSSFRSKKTEIQKFIRYNFYLFFGMAFFAIFIDMISSNWYSWFTVESTNIRFIINGIFTVIEEIGEIGVISIACVWLFKKNFQVSSK